MNKNLKIYKASAGSGKTFTLTTEYIKLLVENPDNYKHILAVTFTNKATSEMKERIVSTLDKLARRDPSADGYLKKIGGDEEKTIRNAGIALEKILHDFSRFRIETIDSFFQSIIRDLAHELGLTANLRVDLDQNSVLHDAVNLIIEDLQNKTDALYYSVRDYIEENIDNGKNWKINDEVEQFASNIFKEAYLNNEKRISEAFKDEKKMKAFKDSIKSQIKECEEGLKRKGKSFLEKATNQGLEMNDFKSKSKGVYPFFENLAKGKIPNITNTVLKFSEEDSSWFSNKSNEIYANEYRSILNDTLDYMEETVKKMNTCTLINEHFNQMKLLSVVNDKVRMLNNDANRFLLAETAHFLNKMIGGSDIPFIYEKSGNRFDHIMIDEFQDTSTLQWKNFTPLLRNSLDSFNTCLIVGDVKQSIYRWRNSDWTILNEINENPDFKDDIETKTLDTNFRSAEKVIKFNNTFFKKIKEECEGEKDLESISKAYSDVKQKVAEKNIGKGYVEVDFIDTKEDYNQNTLEEVELTISRLMAKGVSQNEMAILARTKKSLAMLSAYFAEKNNGINIISNESLELSASTSVQIIIAALKAIAHPDDRFAIATLVHLTAKGKEDACIYIKETEELKKLLPDDFSNHLDELILVPVYELARQIYSIFHLDEYKGQDAYLFCFFDELLNFIKDETTDIDKVLEYWDKVLKEKCIPGGSQDGIQAMTIHKSKGLEFHSVICPFFDWKVKTSDLIWCEPEEKPYDTLPLTAISPTLIAADSIFEDEYEEESVKSYADTLNMIYVAFTRAENNLIIMTRGEMDKNTDSLTAANIIKNITSMMTRENDEDECVLTRYDLTETIQGVGEKGDDEGNGERNGEGNGEGDNEGKTLKSHSLTVCSFGDIVEGAVKEKEIENSCVLNFKSESPLAGFRQSNKALDFANTDEEGDNDRFKYINEGLIMHSIMEIIETPDDLGKALTQLESDGLIANKTYREDVTQLFLKAMENETVKDWFSPRWKVMNECTILDKDRNGNLCTHRPDRVIYDDKETLVIDYKTGKQNNQHNKQVARYVNLLEKMGYKNVSGKVWYMQLGEIVEVK